MRPFSRLVRPAPPASVRVYGRHIGVKGTESHPTTGTEKKDVKLLMPGRSIQTKCLQDDHAARACGWVGRLSGAKGLPSWLGCILGMQPRRRQKMYDRVAIQQKGDQPNRPPILEREPERAAEDDQVTIIDLGQADPAGRSTCSWLATTILKWQRLPQRRYWRLAWLLGLLVVLLMSQEFSSLLVKSLTTPQLPPFHSSPSMLPLPPNILEVTNVHTGCSPPGYHANYPGGAGPQHGAAEYIYQRRRYCSLARIGIKLRRYYASD
jgi:hypothetical protein